MKIDIHTLKITYQSNTLEPHQELLEEDSHSGERYMALAFEPYSSQSISFVESLADEVHAISSRVYRPTGKQKMAIAAVVADLLLIACGEEGSYGYRPRGKDDFVGHRIAYSPCINCLDSLIALGYAHSRPAIWLGTKRTGEGRTSSYRPTTALLERALRFGITPSNWRTHFALAPRPAKMAHPIIVRAKRSFWDHPDKGRRLPIIKTDLGYLLALDQVNRINAYMQPQDLVGFHHDGFIRIFNHGDDPQFAYDMGGRLYALASGVSYQNMAKRYRHSFRINGEPVVEVDLRASFLTIMYGLRGIALDAEVDPYIIGDLPRHVVKAWIAMTLGYDRFHQAWSKESMEKASKDGVDLAAYYPIATVRAKVIDEHRILASWPSSPIRWQHLQNIEATAIIDAVEALALEHDVPALPLHDALLIPVSKVDVARQVLTRTFRRAAGVDPIITGKDRWDKPKALKAA